MLPHAVDVANANDAVVVHADDVVCHRDNASARHVLRRGGALFVSRYNRYNRYSQYNQYNRYNRYSQYNS
jgi:hypothetical protein